MDIRKRCKRSARAVLIIGLATGATACLAGPPADKGNSGKSKGGGDVSATVSVGIDAGISFGDARRLAGQYGLTGAKPLPPGIRKNLARGKPMPPGIQKTRLPSGFLEHLPRHEGYQWERAGSDLVLVVSGSLVITDVLEGVFD